MFVFQTARSSFFCARVEKLKKCAKEQIVEKKTVAKNVVEMTLNRIEMRSIQTVSAEVADVQASLARVRQEFMDAAREITEKGIFEDKTVGGNHRPTRTVRKLRGALKIQHEMSHAMRSLQKVLDGLERELGALKKDARENETVESNLDAFLKGGN